jgi:lactoylglutathione lyase
MASGFHHVHIKSKDPRASAAWWADMFGATVLPEIEFGAMLFAPVELDGVRINITGHGEEEVSAMAEPQSIPYFGLEHLGILVEDLDAILERFAEQELPIYERRSGAGGYEIAYVASPDGVCLELLLETE